MSMQAQNTSVGRSTASGLNCSPFRQSRKIGQRPSSSQQSRRRSLMVSASIIPTGNGIQRGVERFLQKYDVTSASVGALTVTSYCVWRGQDPLTALSITLAATVAALVINEYIFETRQ